MLHLLLTLTALAAPDPEPTVGPWTARTLRWGELSLGTHGADLGLAPQVQVGTSPLLDALGLPTARARVAALETRPVTIAVDGQYTTSSIWNLSASLLEVGPAVSLHAWRLDLHATGRYLVADASGEPRWHEIGVPVAVHAERVLVHGALELAVTRHGSAVATAGAAPWGRASGLLLPFAPLDVITAGALDEAGLEDTWWGTVGWQETAGAFTVRTAIGLSAEPWVWLRDALSLQVRLGPPARHADTEVASDAADATTGASAPPS